MERVGARLSRIRIEQHRRLLDLSAFLDLVDLPLHFVINRLLQEAEGIEVLDLAARAVRLAGAAHRHVGVAAEGTFLHIAVADADPLHELVQLLGIGHGLGAGTHVGLRDDLEQRRSGAVEVDAGASGEILVQRLARILFEVRACQTHGLFSAIDIDGQRTAVHDRQLELTDLVALGQIGVEIVLARKDRTLSDLGADSKAEFDRADYGFAVQYRQYAGQRQTDCVGLRVRLGTEGGTGARKNLRLSLQLSVGFQTDDDFPLHFRFSGISVCQ
jgi:hypothetical protein